VIRFTVTWNDDAVAELAAIWVTAKRRDAITQAGDFIDQALRNDAPSKGEPFGEFRCLLCDGLLIVFSVSDEDRIVRVLKVWDLTSDHPGAMTATTSSAGSACTPDVSWIVATIRCRIDEGIIICRGITDCGVVSRVVLIDQGQEKECVGQYMPVPQHRRRDGGRVWPRGRR